MYPVLFLRILSLELEPVRVVHQSVEDRVGDCGVAGLRVPARPRQLARQQRRMRLIESIADLQDVPALGATHRRHAKVVDNQHIDSPYEKEHLRMTSVCSRKERPRISSLAFRNSAEWTSRQAFSEMARASQVLPVSVGPIRKR